MKNLKLIACAFLVILISSTHLFSQESFSFHFGPSIPGGNFADDSGARYGAAGLGLDLGLQYTYSLSESGLGLFAGVDLSYNGLKKSFRDDIEDELDNNDFDITFPKYLNLPVTGGLNYTLKVNEKVAIYGKGGLAASFLKMTNEKQSFNSDEYVTKYDLSSSFGYILGGGFMINDKTDLSLTYFGLGDHQIDGETDYGHGETEKIDRYKVGVSFTTLTIGFKF